MAGHLVIFGNFDQQTLLLALGSYTVTDWDVSGRAVFVLADTTFTGVIQSNSGSFAYDPVQRELTGQAYQVSLYHNGELVLSYQTDLSLQIIFPGGPDLFLTNWQQQRDVLVGSIYSTQTMTGSAGNDYLSYRGNIKGGNGNDLFEIVETRVSKDGIELIDLTENTVRDRAIGGKGNDNILLGTDDALGRGGAGGDTLTGMAGRAAMVGGSGNDEFVAYNEKTSTFNSGYGGYLGDRKNLVAYIRDFTSGEDTLVFQPPDMPGQSYDSSAPITLEDLFGPGTLADLESFSYDGLDYEIRDPASASIVILRHGITPQGHTVDERVVLRHTDLTDISLADVVVDYPLV